MTLFRGRPRVAVIGAVGIGAAGTAAVAAGHGWLEIDPCHLQFFYQGLDPGSDDGRPYSQLPWKLGLLTRTDAC
jgi:hypothetical protein